MTEVVPEAYELVEHGLLTDDDFRDFMFGNAVRFWGEVNPDFFKGTAVEKAGGGGAGAAGRAALSDEIKEATPMLQRQVGDIVINRVIESERPDFDAGRVLSARSRRSSGRPTDSGSPAGPSTRPPTA